MKAVVFDSESTGFEEGVIIEEAHAEIEFIDGMLISSPIRTTMFNPGKPIEFGAMAVHHIADEDVAECRPASDFALPPDVEYLIGHNIDYDWELIGKPAVKRICTLALSRMIWPRISSHTQMALAYMLCYDLARDCAGKAHRADTDVLILIAILKEMLKSINIGSMEELYGTSEKARIPTVMPFGKHRGMVMADVPKDYFKWMLGRSDIDPYLRRAIEKVY